MLHQKRSLGVRPWKNIFVGWDSAIHINCLLEGTSTEYSVLVRIHSEGLGN